MAKKAKHAFGALENIDIAISSEKVDAYDILFVKDANGKPYVGWVDKDGKKYVVYHTRFNDGGEDHSPRVHQMLMNEDGWPCELPYQTQGETVSENGYDSKEVVGRYYVINQGTDISKSIANPTIFYLTKKGTVVGENIEGTWSMVDGTYYMHITIGDEAYSGVFCRMKDEAGTDVMTFSAVGANQSVWGVQYIEK